MLSVKRESVSRGLQQVEYVGNNGDFDAPYPLAECLGDCDEDEDCAGGLICQSDRDENEAVPGCLGGETDDTDTDYCIQGPPTVPTPSPTLPPGTKLAVFLGNPPPDGTKLGHCEGDCDDDEDCQDGLICYDRDDDDEVPGCYFDGNVGMSIDESHDICIEKKFTHAPTVSPTMAPTTPFPTPGVPAPRMAVFVGNPADDLGPCQADCDSDSDCRGDLMCFDRGSDDPAPGCFFSEEFGMSIEDDSDVCISRWSFGNQHRLRLHWERGYYWQEESREQYFCLEADGDSAVVGRCSGSSRQIFEFRFLESGEAMIYYPRDDSCLDGRHFQDCDEKEADQRWFPANGRWQDVKFELSNRADPDECFSPHHHPRDGEGCYMLNCREERRYTTNAWTLYW